MAIQSSLVRIYSDQSLQTLVKTVNGGTTSPQAVSVTGLHEHTDYWAVASATDSNSNTGSSQPYHFQTLWSEPVLGITATGITQTTAVLTFSYTGNYPIDTTNYSDVHATYNVKNDLSTLTTLQFGTLANGTPESISLSGLTPNTTYVVDFAVDYYNGEVTQQIEFTTLSSSAPTVTITSVSNITDTTATVNLTITE